MEEEQGGADRAQYGKEVIRELAARLTSGFGSGFSKSNLEYMRRFYLVYPNRSSQIAQTLSGQSVTSSADLPFALSWSHYVFLLGLNEQERKFCEIEGTTRESMKSDAVLSVVGFRMPDFPFFLWLCVADYGIHVLEEFAFNWQSWALNVLNLPARWDDFYITNALVISLGIVAVMIAPRWPMIASGFPSLMLINALGFHIAPFAGLADASLPACLRLSASFYPLES